VALMRLSHGVLGGLAGLGMLALAPNAGAGELDDLLDSAPAISLPSPTLALDLTEVLARAAQPPADAAQRDATATATPPEVCARALGYGRSGSRWWTVGVAVANNFQSATDSNIHLAFSEFLADDFEFAVEAAVWYFHQPGDDTGGVSGSMIFRWHFLHAEDYKWSVFGDAGIGILGAFDNVPDGGTGFDFLPRLGGGFTYALDDSVDGESRGSRIMVGVRYHHISNGRISGDSRNPARDGVAIYAALVIPF
jgi:hypothetical protein